MPPKPSSSSTSAPKSPELEPSTPSPPRSPQHRPRGSRNPSIVSTGRRDHVPHQPSALRRSIVPGESSSPEDNRGIMPPSQSNNYHGKRPSMQGSGIRPTDPAGADIEENDEDQHAEIAHSFFEPNVRTRLLGNDNWDTETGCGCDDCRHGSFSIRPTSPRQGSKISYGSFDDQMSDEGFGGPYLDGMGTNYNESADPTHALLGDTIADGILGGGDGNKMSTTNYLAKRHGVRSKRRMYIFYYIPFFNWVRQYKWSYFKGDLIAALTMASFYIPMSLSYASNLGHIPPVNGLYAFVFNPFLYALLGTCPQMVVGPEAAGSLLTGQVVRENIDKGKVDDGDQVRNAQIAGMTTFMAGAVILLAGIFRLGFLDNMLSRPFLRGFISAIGIVIFIDQLIPEMGLQALAATSGVEHGSCVDKMIFVIKNIRHAHGVTSAVSFGAFGIIMFFREAKNRLQPRYPSVAYIPDRFIVVVLSAILTWKLGWDKQGLDILGDIKAKGKPFPVHFPLGITHLKYASDAFSTSFVIALLGFFESSVAAKSLGVGESSKKNANVLKNMHLSANRELIALGAANVVGGLFMALPAFGGYGRSKVNASTGGRTPMSSILLSIITVFSVLFMLPWFYYLPKGVLCAMISVVAYSLLEEAPPDILFFIRIRGISELSLMFLIFLSTIFWNLKVGIAVGIGLSLLRVLKHSTRPRIQILGRVPGTTDKFENAERGMRVEFVEGVLIVKIPEPLTFANTGDLKGRLRRLEEHGTGKAHPALPPVRRQYHNQNVVFDVHGVTSLDGAGAQILMEIVRGYRDRNVRVFFCRINSEKSSVFRLLEKSGVVELCGGRRHFLDSVEEALRMTELEGDELSEHEFRDA